MTNEAVQSVECGASKEIGEEILEKASSVIQRRIELCEIIQERINAITDREKDLTKICPQCGSGVVRPQIESTLLRYFRLIHTVRRTMESHVLTLDLARHMELTAILTSRALFDVLLPAIADPGAKQSLIRSCLSKLKPLLEDEIKKAVMGMRKADPSLP